LVRPSKPINANNKHLTKKEILERSEQENRLKGNSDNVTPSYYLVDRQEEVFNWLVSEMSASGILSNLDSVALSAYSFAIVQFENLNDMANRNPENLFDKQFLQARNQFIQELKRYDTEFCMTPQSRAKMGNATITKKEKEQDPLLKALKVVK
jgi:phage terminase small subunit